MLYINWKASNSFYMFRNSWLHKFKRINFSLLFWENKLSSSNNLWIDALHCLRRIKAFDCEITDKLYFALFTLYCSNIAKFNFKFYFSNEMFVKSKAEQDSELKKLHYALFIPYNINSTECNSKFMLQQFKSFFCGK